MGAVTVCSVGTTHPWNVAGIGLDARVCARLGARHVAVVAGVSAQGSGVGDQVPMLAAIIGEQFRALAQAGIAVYRIGALLSVESVAAVAEALTGSSVPIVCDPVIASSSGQVFADAATIDALRTLLFPLCTVVTPNLTEASRLCGFPVNDRATMAMAAHALAVRDGARAALVTGGHLHDEASDVLYADGKTETFAGGRIGGGMRGTGCVLATALAVELARGAGLMQAVERARELVRDAIRNAAEWNGQRVWPW